MGHPRGGPSSTVSGSDWNLEMLVIEERGKPEYLKKNLSKQGQELANPTHISLTPNPGIEPEPRWWEASALTTAPSCLP